MSLTLRPLSSSPEPFSWNVPSPPDPPSDAASLPDAPTTWLSSKDMKVFGARPMKNDQGIIRCNDCLKAIQKSGVGEHLGASQRLLRIVSKCLDTE
jgi:SAGA-associated factor 73